jgi:aspartate kinase
MSTASFPLDNPLTHVDDPPGRAVRHRIVVAVGGSDIESPTAMMRTAKTFAAIRQAGNDVVGVIEAPADQIMQLLALALDVASNPGGRELDALFASGEQAACSLLAMAMREIGLPAVSLAGGRAGILTDEHHGRAVIVELALAQVRRALRLGLLPVVTGGQGETNEGELTTLSCDVLSTAHALASALRAGCTTTESIRGLSARRGGMVSVVRAARDAP